MNTHHSTFSSVIFGYSYPLNEKPAIANDQSCTEHLKPSNREKPHIKLGSIFAS